MEKYKMISFFDGNDSIELEVEEGECPETAALNELGWYILKEKPLEDSEVE